MRLLPLRSLPDVRHERNRMERFDKLKGVFKRRENKEDAPAVSPAVIRRLPRYHRYLLELSRQGKMRVSSQELAALMEVTASQIRQDLNCFGGFGQQGYGYNVRYLTAKIDELRGVTEGYRAVVVGAGNLGRALVSSHMFERRGVKRLALFDVNPALIGTTVSGLPILSYEDMEDYCRENHVEIAVLTTPKEAAGEALMRLARAGVRGIWNFSNTELHAPNDDMTVQDMHIGDSLMTLCYQIKKKAEENGKAPRKESGDDHE